MSIPPSMPPTHPQANQPPASTPRLEAPPPTTSPMDPTGAWQRFLGPTATPQEVQLFIQGMLKTLATQIQQDDAALKKEAEHQKRVIEGDDD